MKSSDLLIVVGGDGTQNVAVDAILKADIEKRAPLIAVPFGNANDFSRSINGKMGNVNALSRVLESGKLVHIHPMNVRVNNDLSNINYDRIAINNAGFNYTANVAQLLNEPDHRSGILSKFSALGNLAQEARTLFRSTKDLEPFYLYDNETEQDYMLLDRTFVHARTASKFGHFAIDHFSDEFLDISTARATRPAVCLAAARMVLSLSGGTRQKEVSFQTGATTLLGHVDGEAFPILPLATVTTTLSEDSFSTYSLLAKK